MEIKVTQMKPSDEVTIRTRFNDYCFRMINPLECRWGNAPRTGGSYAALHR